MKLVLTIYLTDDPRASSWVQDGLSDALYDLAQDGFIDDSEDAGWAYEEKHD